MVTDVPIVPDSGLNDVTDGRTVTANGEALTAVPPGVAMEIGPLVAVAGTLAVICVSDSTVYEAGTSLNVTAEAPVKADPVIVTMVPIGPDAGTNDEIDGGGTGGGDCVTTKLASLVDDPPGVVTEIGPVVAPTGTVAVIWVSESTAYEAGDPLNVTLDVRVKAAPVIVTTAPTAPDAGSRPEIDGGAGSGGGATASSQSDQFRVCETPGGRAPG